MNHSVRIPVIIILLISLTLCLNSCKPKPTLPVVTTTNVTGITQTTATTGGNVTSDGNADVTSRGVCWNSSENPTVANTKTSDGTGTGSFTSSLTQLTPGTTYYVRAYATNSEGTSYGSQVSFNSNPIVLATLTTTTIGSITSTTVVSGGNITDDGGGAITARGVCWSKTQNPTTANSKTTDGSGTGSFTSNITVLSPNTPYYVRAYATNSAGTAYGDEKSLTTLQLKDADGNVYTTVTIGTQVWMVENLKTTKYNDGTAIPNVTGAEWNNLTTGAYCWYNNDEANKTPYGGLYNWNAVNTGKLCLTGWHVPSDNEWHQMILFLDPSAVLNDPESLTAGAKLKESGTTHWASPNTGATNETGFTALPGGYRFSNFFDNMGRVGYYWKSGSPAIMCHLLNGSNAVFRNPNDPKYGLSVRCIKD